MKTLCTPLWLFIILSWSTCPAATEHTIPDQEKGKLLSLYAGIEKTFFEGGADIHNPASPYSAHEISVLGSIPKTYSIRGRITVQIPEGSSAVSLVYNHALMASLDGVDSSQKLRVPRLSFTQAIEGAKKQLARFAIALPEDARLNEVQFGRPYSSCWLVCWQRTYKGYQWDTFVTKNPQSFAVVFHEELGLVMIERNIANPPPNSVDANINREDAIIKASRLAPLVMETSFYRSARAKGFVVQSLKECELKLVVPNWLLDPKRAVWNYHERPLTESRLCWAVIFRTRDSLYDRELKLQEPDIVIYLDAVTGECVGADFS